MNAGSVPAQVLEKLMRHTSIRTAMDYYANVDDAAMEAEVGAKRNGSRDIGRAGGDCAGADNASGFRDTTSG